MEEVLSGIYLFRGEVSNIYLVKTHHKGYVLIDTGTPRDPVSFISQMNSMGLKPSDVKYILITHAHWDHVGGLAELKEITNALVVVHIYEVLFIERGGQGFRGVKVDISLRDDDSIDGFLAIHTPGHTPGSMCYLNQDHGALFIGDLVYEENGVLHEMFHKYSQDPSMNRKSIAKLLAYNFKHVMPSHGDPILWRGREVLENLVKELGVRD